MTVAEASWLLEANGFRKSEKAQRRYIDDSGDVRRRIRYRELPAPDGALTIYELDEDDETPEEDVRGTISELANIIAGVVKSKVGLSTLKLGIPMVVSGRVTPANQQEAASDLVKFGPVSLEIFLLYRRKRTRKSAA